MKVVFLVTFPLALPSWLLSKFPTATTSASSTAAGEGVGGGGGFGRGDRISVHRIGTSIKGVFHSKF